MIVVYLKLGYVVLCNVYCLEKKMNKISMLSMAISLMAGFAYAEEAKVGDVAPAASGEETATTTEVTPSEAPVADESTPVVPEKPVAKPVEPKLVYFKKDPQILNLVSLRMSDNPLTHQVYTLVLSNSSGIKVKDAIKIDAALSAMKCSGNATLTSEAESESRRFFEYEIDF